MSETEFTGDTSVSPPSESDSFERGSEEHFEALKDRYKFFIMNNEGDGVAFELNYVTDEGWDKPVLYNTGGRNMMHSLSASVGGEEDISFDSRFPTTIAYSYHQVVAFIAQPNPERVFELIDDTIEMFYENDAGVNQVPIHEEWAIHEIVKQMVYTDEVIYELGPFVEYTDGRTEFGVPDVKPRENEF